MTIYTELLEVAAVAGVPLSPRTEGEADQVWLGRLVRSVATLTGEQFNTMSEPAQLWFDKAANAFNHTIDGKVEEIPAPEGFGEPPPRKIGRPTPVTKVEAAPDEPSVLPDPIVLPPDPPHPTPTPDPLPDPQAEAPVEPVEPPPSVLPDPPPLPPDPPYTEPVAEHEVPPPLVASDEEAPAKKRRKRVLKARKAKPEVEVEADVVTEVMAETIPGLVTDMPREKPKRKGRQVVEAENGLTVSQRVRQYIIEDQRITIDGIVERLRKEHLEHATKRSTISTLRYDTVCTLLLVQQAGWAPQQPQQH